MTSDVILVNCPPQQETTHSVSLLKRQRLPEDDSDVDTGNTRRRRRKMIKRRPKPTRHTAAKAPINTTQFLMNDMKSISPTSDWERFNHSDSDQEEYEEKEFSKDYAEESTQFGDLYQTDLINEYLSLEKSVSSIERRHTALHNRGQHSQLHYDRNVLEKIRIFQEEIHKIKEENLELSTENSRLLAEKLSQSARDSSDSSSSDSDSDSDGSTDESCSDTDSSCSDSDEEFDKEKYDDNPREDTGYESDTNLEVSSST